MSSQLPALGAPGIYPLTTPPPRALLGARMDVCAFVGVAPRGPARVPYTDEEWLEAGLDPGRARGGLGDLSDVDPLRPRRRSKAVAVESWDEYRRLYGGFEGPGRLPYAVASFFEQGGRRAYVVRIVHDYVDRPLLNRLAVARAALKPVAVEGGAPLKLRARNEGAWGNALRGTLSFAARPLLFEAASPTTLTIRPELDVGVGTLLRLGLTGGVAALRFVADVVDRPLATAQGRRRTVTLAAPLGAAPVAAEIVEATLELDDGDGRTERHEALGLSPAHPRFLASVLCAESTLVYPDPKWVTSEVLPASSDLPEARTTPFRGGRDRYPDLVPDDFFDAEWVLGDEGPAAGVHALVGVSDLSSLVVPDLYEPAPLPDVEEILDPPTLAGPTFQPCVDPVAGPPQGPPAPGLDGLLLDPTVPSDLARIVSYQERLEGLADDLRSFVVLLDVPPSLDQRRILAWRARFDSSFVAAYHPWLVVVRSDDRRRAKVRLNPSAAAAGIVAARERRLGVPFGPSNEIAAGVVDVADRVSPERHDELHPQGINVYLRERDGIRLTAARTLSRDPAYRQLSVRRLMTMIGRTLEQELDWLVFEPNGPSLWADLRHLLEAYLRRLYRANAFTGSTEAEAFFVRCDEAVNPQASVDAGRLVAEIGVAPAEPLEFLVVRLVRDGDGTLLVESSRG